MRKILIGLVGVVVLLVAAALTLPGVIDWNRYKGEIAQQVKAATGRDLTIRGDLDIAVLPQPRLSVADVRFASIPGTAEPDMVRLKSLDVRVKILPLLQGRIEVASVTLLEPVIVLEKLADGRTNWTFAPQAGPGTSARPGTAREPGASTAAVGVDSLRIRQGTVIWRDGEAKTVERFEQVDAEIAATSLAGPFHVKGSLTARGVPLALTVGVGRIGAEGVPAPVSLTLNLPKADARAEFSGTLAGPLENARLNGKLDLSGKDLARLALALSGPGAAPPPPTLGQAFALAARVTASPQGGGLADIEAEFGGARATGDLNIVVGDRVRADARLRIAHVDLARWFAAAKPAAAAAAAQPDDKTTAPAQPSGAAPAAPFALPEAMDGSLDLTIAAITWGGEAVQDVRIHAQLANRALTVRQASLRLPGGGEAGLNGSLVARNDRPNFDGMLEVRADNLRAILGWMKVDVTGVPADRLRKFALSTRLRSDDRQLQVLGAKISLDTSRIDAGVTLALRERLAFGASVTVDQLNLDAYTPRDGASSSPAVAPPAGTAPGRDGAAAARSGRGPLAALNDFDANIRLQVGSLTYNRTPVRDVRFEGTLAQGQLAIRDASVGNLAGTAARINGTLSGFDAIPVFRGGFAADSNDISGVLRVAGLSPPAAARGLGKVSLRGKAEGGAERVKLDTTLALAGGKLTVSGTVDGLPAAPRFDAKIGADHADPARLARAFGIDMPGGKDPGPLALEATLKGDQKALSADTKLKAFGGDIALAGSVAGFAAGTPSIDGTLKASHPSFNALMQGVAPDYRPAGRNIGPVRVEASLKGTPAGAEITGLSAQAGKAALSGQGRLAFDGPRPKLAASLTGGAIDLNPFLPADSAPAQRKGGGAAPPIPGPGGGSAQPPAGEHFSSDPFDVSPLRDFDADLSLGTEAIQWRNFQVDKPTVKVTLADSLLTVEQMAGRMFDGAFLMKGKLNARGRPAIDGTVTIEKANVGKALFDAGSFDVAGGTLDFTMALAGSGGSPRDLVSALDGDGRLSVKDGVVKGFDLQAASDRLKNIDRGLDILKLFGAAMGGGDTRFSSLAGTFRMEKGVLRTDDLKLVAQAGEGQAKGFADLPRWFMDFAAQFRLTEHPKAPPFGMTVRGAIDNPQRVFRFQDLQNHLLQRGVGTLLRRVLPGQEQPQAPQSQPSQSQPSQSQPSQSPPPQQPQQPQRPRPEDILKDLLKGLGR